MADKKKILIADDFQLLREDLTELINNQRDMEVVGTASSGKEIVNLARNTEYDLILMDIEMSNKNHETVMQEYARLQQSEKSLLFFINNISKLTATEREMIKLLLQGYKVHEIAEARSVEVSTIKTQIKGLLRKFGCSRTKEIVQIIRELNIEHLF